MSRRTAPTAGRQQSQQRAPQPSIKSSHAFAPQPTQNLNQHQQMNAKKQMQQQQMQQQQMQQQQMQQQQLQMKNYQNEYPEEYNEKEHIANITKMTVAQAITLITLRLGSIETKLMNNDVSYMGMGSENSNSDTLSVFSNRLDALETKLNLASSTDYKQQFEHLTQALIQSKNLSNVLVKENKELKMQLTNLKKEMSDSKELIEMIRITAANNENKILQMLNVTNDIQMDEQIEIDGDLNLSDSEHGHDSIVETDITQTLEYEDDNELNMSKIDSDTSEI